MALFDVAILLVMIFKTKVTRQTRVTVPYATQEHRYEIRELSHKVSHSLLCCWSKVIAKQVFSYITIKHFLEGFPKVFSRELHKGKRHKRCPRLRNIVIPAFESRHIIFLRSP